MILWHEMLREIWFHKLISAIHSSLGIGIALLMQVSLLIKDIEKVLFMLQGLVSKVCDIHGSLGGCSTQGCLESVSKSLCGKGEIFQLASQISAWDNFIILISKSRIRGILSDHFRASKFSSWHASALLPRSLPWAVMFKLQPLRLCSAGWKPNLTVLPQSPQNRTS